MMNCVQCGRFFSWYDGMPWKMVYSGAIPMPDHEIYKCAKCAEKHGPFEPDGNIKPEFSCGIYRSPKTTHEKQT